MILRFVESDFSYLYSIIPLFHHRLFPQLAMRVIGNGFTASNYRCEEEALGEIYGNDATARALRTYIHIYLCTRYAHSDM